MTGSLVSALAFKTKSATTSHQAATHQTGRDLSRLAREQLADADRRLLQALADGYDKLEAYEVAGFAPSGGRKALHRLANQYGVPTHESLLALAVKVGWVTVE